MPNKQAKILVIGDLMIDHYLWGSVNRISPEAPVQVVDIEKKLDFQATVKDDFKTLMEFTKYIASSKLFVSTSTGPMHLAGLTNTKTLSFFGDKLFASPKRWGTISEESYQSNFTVPMHYSTDFYTKIETRLIELLNE